MKTDMLILRLSADTLECSYHDVTGSPIMRQFTDFTEPEILCDLPATDSTLLLLSAEYFYFREVTLPVEDYSLTPQTLSWLTEDAVAENSEELHWTILDREGDRLQLAGIRKTVLADILQTLQFAGVIVRHAMPEGYGLPYHAESWTLLQQEERWLMRYAEHKFSVLSTALLEHLLMRNPAQKILSFNPLPVNHEPTEYLPVQDMMTCWHQQMPTAEVNLLHGSFHVHPAVMNVKPVLKKIACSALILALFTWVCAKGLLFWQLSQQNAELSARGKALWSSYFPTDKRNGNYKFFFESAAGQTWPDVMSRLSLISRHLQASPMLKIRQFAYDKDKRTLTLTLKVEDAGQLVQFIQRSREDFNFTPSPSETAGLTVLTSWSKP